MRKVCTARNWGVVAGLLLGVSHGGAAEPDPGEIPADWLTKYPEIRREEELVSKPKPLKRAKPDYPESLREEGIVGRATVAVVIAVDGSVAEGRVLGADYPELGKIALDTLRRTPFAPGKVDGQSVPSQFIVTLRFGMEKEARFDEPPRPRFQAKPIYPYYMRMAGIAGEVTVRFLVNKKGEVEAAYPVESSHPAFRQSAVDAVEQWRFRPAKKDGKPVSAVINVPIIFSIKGEPGASRGWSVSRPDKHPDNLPDWMKWDTAPQLLIFNPPVYPRNALLDGVKGTVEVRLIVAPEGNVLMAKAIEPSSAELGAAAVAAVETFRFKPAEREGVPCGALLAMEFDFKVSDSSDAPVTAETRRVLKTLRRNPDRIHGSAHIDEVPRVLIAKEPTIPTEHRDSAKEGLARVEIIVSRRGTVELPRVLEATSPAYGHAAIQALADWQFEPPRLDGKVVDTRMVVPIVFNPSSPETTE